MTTETTVSKGQEFFSPGQMRGNSGDINWERCLLLLLLTQPRWTMQAGRGDIYSQLFLEMKDYNKRGKKQGASGTKSFHVSLRRGHPVLSYDNILCLLRSGMTGSGGAWQTQFSCRDLYVGTDFSCLCGYNCWLLIHHHQNVQNRQ